MTKKFLQIFQTFLILTVLSISLLKVEVSARQPDTIDSSNTPIPVDEEGTITYAFSYGSPTAEIFVLRDAVASLTIDGDDFEFVTTGFEDWYYGDPNRSDTDPNIPQQISCNVSGDYSGPKYPISPSLASPTSLTYGLQSARDLNSPSGTATAGLLNIDGEIYNGLREKHTGCIRIELKVSENATPGSTTDIIFDQDANLSPDYQEDRRPGRQILRLSVAEAQASSPSSSPASSVSSTVSSTPSSISSVSSSQSVVSSISYSTTSTSVENTVPTGGLNIMTGLGLFATSLLGFIFYKSRTKKIKKIDIN